MPLQRTLRDHRLLTPRNPVGGSGDWLNQKDSRIGMKGDRPSTNDNRFGMGDDRFGEGPARDDPPATIWLETALLRRDRPGQADQVSGSDARTEQLPRFRGMAGRGVEDAEVDPHPLWQARGVAERQHRQPCFFGMTRQHQR